MRPCNICGAEVDHLLVQDYPAAVVARAKALQLTVEEHVKRHMAHVSYTVVRFAAHEGPCGLHCIGIFLPEERRTLRRGAVHDGISCPCVSPEPAAPPAP